MLFNSSSTNTTLVAGGFVIICLLLIWVWRLITKLNKLKKTPLKGQENSHLISMLSHELRTPLYAVTAISQSLLENNPKKSQLEDLYVLDKAASYLVKLINDALLINKMDAHKLKKIEEDFNIDELLSLVVKTTQNHIKGRSAEILIKKEAQLPKHFKGDALKITQILINLVSNAIKFGGDKPIHIHVKHIKNTAEYCDLEFSVTDHGKGILAADRDKILHRFHQLDTIKTEFGSGLGLFIVVQLLKSLDSQLDIKSELNKGSCFSFKVRMKTPTEPTEKFVEQIDSSQLKGRRILVVDDNFVNQTITKKTLEKKGVITSVCNSGKEAIRLLKEGKYHAVLMDLYMPEMSGEKATEIIRTFDASIPIIALTAIDKEGHWEQLKDCGFSAILNKPYHEVNLYKTLLDHIEIAGKAL